MLSSIPGCFGDCAVRGCLPTKGVYGKPALSSPHLFCCPCFEDSVKGRSNLDRLNGACTQPAIMCVASWHTRTHPVELQTPEKSKISGLLPSKPDLNMAHKTWAQDGPSLFACFGLFRKRLVGGLRPNLGVQICRCQVWVGVNTQKGPFLSAKD